MRVFEFLCFFKIAVAAAFSNARVNLHNRRFTSQAWRTQHFAQTARRGEEKNSPLPSSRASRKIKAAFTSLVTKSACYAGYARSHLRLSHISIDGLPFG